MLWLRLKLPLFLLARSLLTLLTTNPMTMNPVPDTQLLWPLLCHYFMGETEGFSLS